MNKKKVGSVYHSIMLVVITALITCMLTAMGLYNYYTKNDKGRIKTLVKYIDLSGDSEDIAKEIEVIKQKLEQRYIGELDTKKMTEMAIKGYVDGVGDTYTEYLTKDEYEDLLISVKGDYVGIGIYMTQDDDGNIVVVLPMEGSPAEEAGLQIGDKIISIDGESCIGMDINIASNKIKGESGTIVELEILREGETINKKIERRKVDIKNSYSTVLEENIGYIVLKSFDSGCSREIGSYLEDFRSKGITSVIFDLRNNTGGIVTEAVEISELFVPKGNVIMRSYNKQDQETLTESKASSTYSDMKVVLLINGYSASASEIVTGAFKDNDVATIVGTKTYGKGVMQEIEKVFEGALKITIEEFKTPNGDIINKNGIEPDIVIEDDATTEEDEQLNKAIELLK